MSLSDFLADDSKIPTGSGSWADDVADLPSAPKEDRSEGGYASRGFGGGDRYGGGGDRREGGFERREGGFGGGERREGGFERERSFAPRAPVELPTQPPYTAHIANLSFDSSEDDLTDLFAGLSVNKMRLMRDRETDRSKGFGYIEFDDLESLKRALELNGENVQGRSIRVNIAEPPRGGDERTRQPDRTDVDTWRRTGPLEMPEQPRRTFGARGGDTSWGGRSGGDSFGSRERTERPSERPRLNLKPRTVEAPAAAAAPARSTANKPDPFGGARPVDTDKGLSKVEKKLDEPTQ
ncbi:hypothetical protein MFLAVUS_001831 [Mucor flavus]|uniref:RRM domain-containing protein n=1 Tax=Mucor flavus TaxID=439312 RepID=A0ABP9YNJ0_9FUNG